MDDELTPQQTERVRRLLAEARHTDPIPDDVAARIDRALADATVEPVAGAPVVRLAERRRKVGRMLLAAAAVVVGGVALGQVVGAPGENSATDTASSEADSNQLPAPDRDGDAQYNGNLHRDDAEIPGAVSESRRSISKLAARQIDSARFAREAVRLRRLALAHRSFAGQTAAGPESTDASGLEVCSPGVWGGGRYVRVGFDGSPGWLVYRVPRGDTQVVDLFLCGEDAPERSATLPFDR